MMFGDDKDLSLNGFRYTGLHFGFKTSFIEKPGITFAIPGFSLHPFWPMEVAPVFLDDKSNCFQLDHRKRCLITGGNGLLEINDGGHDPWTCER